MKLPNKSVDTAALGELFREGVAKSQGIDPSANESATDEQAPAEQPIETAEEETQEVGVVASEVEEHEGQVEETEAIETSEEDYEMPSDLNGLATAIEVDPEFLYNIKIPLADGLEPISLSELKDGYQNYKKSSNVDFEALEKERAEFEAYKQQQSEQIRVQTQAPQEILTAQAEALSIASQYNSIDWDQYEKDDPANAALTKQKLGTAYSQAQQKYQALNQQYQQKQVEEYQKFASAERSKMLKAIPEWQNDKVRVEEQEKIRGLLRDYGYTDNDINAIADHRAMRMARDLLQHKGQMDEAMKTVKKITKMPKPLRGGKGVRKVVKGPSDTQRKAVERAKKSKRTEDKVAGVSAILQGLN